MPEDIMSAAASLQIVDVLGFAASGATLCAFAQRRMTPMRVSALAANIFFIAYGALGSFYPVLLLHLILLPLNARRLIESAANLRPRTTRNGSEDRSTLVEEWLCRHGRSSTPPRAAPWRPNPRGQATAPWRDRRDRHASLPWSSPGALVALVWRRKRAKLPLLQTM
jgi:hypothetical protein